MYINLCLSIYLSLSLYIHRVNPVTVAPQGAHAAQLSNARVPADRDLTVEVAGLGPFRSAAPLGHRTSKRTQRRVAA